MSEPFRWPLAGDIALGATPGNAQNASIAGNLEMRLYLMTDGYRRAADVLVDRAIAEKDDRDLLVCPIVFSYRHFLELSLKSQMAAYGTIVGVKANWRTHRLEKLWVPFKEMLDAYGNQDPDQADGRIEAIIMEFAKIDPDSFSNRYPVDKDGKALPLAIDELDLAQLKDVMEGVANYFSGCDGFLSDLQGTVSFEVG